MAAQLKSTKLDKAKIRIILDHGWIAPTLGRYPLKFRDDIALAGIDRKGQIFINPEAVECRTVPQIVHLLAHEVMHRWGLDAVRVGERDRKEWNKACDAYINDVLVDSKIGDPIEGGVYIPGSRDRTKEDIYDELMRNRPKGGDKGGKGEEGLNGDFPVPGDGDDGKFDDLLDENGPMTEQEQKDFEEQVRMEVQEAENLAKMQGKAGASVRNFLAGILKSTIPWHEKLAPFMTNLMKQDTTWTRPNRRFISMGILLPSTARVPSMGGVTIMCDVSGSIGQAEYDHFNGHMKAIIEQCNPAYVDVVYCDTRVVQHDHYEQDLDEVEIKYSTGGGTDMPAGLDWIEEQGLNPDCVVVFTDGYTNWPTHAYPWPVAWVISNDQIKAPEEHGVTIPFEITK